MTINKKNILAICYDFDKTLSPDDMQAQGFIQSLGQEVEEFWNESNKLVTMRWIKICLGCIRWLKIQEENIFLIRKR